MLQWEAQIASDISAGTLDNLVTEALAEHNRQTAQNKTT